MSGTEDKFCGAPEGGPRLGVAAREGTGSSTNAFAARLVLPGSPFELTTPGTDATGVRTFRHAPPSLNDVYRRAAASAERPYMVFRGCTMSFGDLFAEAHGLALKLLERGAHVTGQRIGIVLPSCPQWLVAFVAVTSIGAVATLIDPSAPTEQIRTALSAANCVALIAEESTAQRLQGGDTRLRTVIARTHTLEREFLFEGIEPQTHLPHFGTAINPDQEALIAFTSGSTGQPKGVISTHRAVITGMMNMMLGSALAATRSRSERTAHARRQRSPSSLLLSPFTHIAGYSHLLLMMWGAGKVATLPSWNPDEALELIKREELGTISGASPDMLKALLRTDPQRHDLSGVSGIGVHGALVRPMLLREIRERLPHAVPMSGYGLTETNGSICVAAGNEVMEQSCGPVVPSVQVRILDSAGRDVPTCTVGEIWVRGAMLMSGYCPAQGSSAVQHDGWFRTEDFGRLDASANLFLTERRHERVDVGGKQISCTSLEHLACDVGGFDDAAAFAIGDGDDVRVMLAVVPHPLQKGREALIIEQLLSKICRVDMVIVEGLPRTQSGKIDRRALRQQLNA